jgi:hypothetical protein
VVRGVDTPEVVVRGVDTPEVVVRGVDTPKVVVIKAVIKAAITEAEAITEAKAITEAEAITEATTEAASVSGSTGLAGTTLITTLTTILITILLQLVSHQNTLSSLSLSLPLLHRASGTIALNPRPITLMLKNAREVGRQCLQSRHPGQ